jgi:hypothetical protein
MELFRQGLLAFHIAIGLAALVLFWVPALTKKGSPSHRRAGRWYVRAMTAITITGVILSLFYIFGPRWTSGVFLLFLGVITGTSLWNGWRVLRVKQDPARYYGTRGHRAVALLNVLGGLTLIGFGIVVKEPLFAAFGPVGVLIGGAMLGSGRRVPGDRQYWKTEHLTGMIGSGIASHVAFLAFGGRQLFGWDMGGYGIVLWVTPVIVGTIAITTLRIYYRTKPAPAAAVLAS